MKYPEYREQFKDAKRYKGHLCYKGGLYYKFIKHGLITLKYDELSDFDKKIIAQVIEEEKAKTEQMNFFLNVLIPAKNKVIKYAREHGVLERSSQSESEYWRVNGYTIRISGHIYPTGSMTDYTLGILDTTDYDCREFCKILGI